MFVLSEFCAYIVLKYSSVKRTFQDSTGTIAANQTIGKAELGTVHYLLEGGGWVIFRLTQLKIPGPHIGVFL